MRICIRKALAAGSLIALVSVTGCASYQNLNSLSLPGTKGTGPESYSVRIEVKNALNIVPNSPVRVGDLNVGTIRSIELDGWTPVVTVSLGNDVDLPANATAKIGQSSLLGAKHIELQPPQDNAPKGRLGDGDVIPRERSGSYPETEDVLASAATLLNGGGLTQIKTITTELNRALGGREGTTRSLLTQVEKLVTGLDQQKGDITRAIKAMDRLASGFRQSNPTIERALDSFPGALRVLNSERRKLVETMESLGEFGGAAQDVVDRGGKNLVRNVAALRPTLKALADAGDSLHESLWLMGTVSFPLKYFGEYLRGDFINLWGTVDLGLDSLDRGLLSGTPFEGMLGGPQGLLGQLMGLSGQAGNPLTDPVKPPSARSSGDPESPSPSKRPRPGSAGTDAEIPDDNGSSDDDETSGGGLLGSLLGSGDGGGQR